LLHADGKFSHTFNLISLSLAYTGTASHIVVAFYSLRRKKNGRDDPGQSLKKKEEEGRRI